MYKLSWRPAKGRGSLWRKKSPMHYSAWLLASDFWVSYFILSFPRYLQGLILCSFVQHYSFFYSNVLFLYPLLRSELFDSLTMYSTYLATQNDFSLWMNWSRCHDMVHFQKKATVMLLKISFVIHDRSMALVTCKKCCFTCTNRSYPFIS